MFYPYLWTFRNWFIAMYYGRSGQKICLLGTCNVFQLWGCSRNFNARTSWIGNLHIYNIQAVTLHPWLISDCTQIFPPPELPLSWYMMVYDTFICPATWIWIQFLNHAGMVSSMLWLKLFNHTGDSLQGVTISPEVRVTVRRTKSELWSPFPFFPWLLHLP